MSSSSLLLGQMEILYEMMTLARTLQMLSIFFALVSAALGFWASMLEPLVLGSYWQPTASAVCALVSALIAIAAVMAD